MPLPSGENHIGYSTVGRARDVEFFSQCKMVTVSTSATKLLDKNEKRNGFVFTNHSFTDAFVGGPNIVANAGALLTSDGGAFGSSQVDGFIGELWAITSLGTTNIGILEW